MKRVLFCVAAAVTAIAAFLPPPASAASPPIHFEDEAGDGRLGGATSPAPTDPTIDIVGGTVAREGENLVFSMRFADFDKIQPDGARYQFALVAGNIRFQWNIYRDTTYWGAESIFLSTSPEASSDPLESPECGCRTRANLGDETYSLIQPISGLNRVARAIDRENVIGDGTFVSSFELAVEPIVAIQAVPGDTADGGDLEFVL